MDLRQTESTAKSVVVKSQPVAATTSDMTSKNIQIALSNAGYYNGSIDGKIGPKSQKAIREFQAERLNIHPEENPQVITPKDLNDLRGLKEPVWEGEKKEEVVKLEAPNKGEVTLRSELKKKAESSKKNEPNKKKQNVKNKEISKPDKPNKSKNPKSNSSPKKVAKEEVVENIPKEQDHIDLQPGVTYKFEK